MSVDYELSYGFKQGRGRFVLCGGILSILFFVAGISLRRAEPDHGSAGNRVVAEDRVTPVSVRDNFYDARISTYDEIRPGESLLSALSRLEMSKHLANRFSTAIGREINLRELKPGDRIMIESMSGGIQPAAVDDFAGLSAISSVVAVELFSRERSGVLQRIRAALNQETGDIDVALYSPKVHVERTMLHGVVSDSIYNAIVSNGGSAQLVNDFSDIFAWQFDFYKDTRAKDRYQMILEMNVSDGRVINHGRVLAAEYQSGSSQLRAFYFKSDDGLVSGYFDNKGKSLKNAFLRAPLKLASISSRFGMRYHPIQRRMKPHNGVDYGANRGTPFMAVANGVVTDAGYHRYNGNWIRIKHANGYETEYLHASRLAKGIRVGAKVQQGDVIGFVGKTGMATGYHLHYGVLQGRRYVDPASLRFTRSASVPPKYLVEFKNRIEPMVIALNRRADSQEILALND